MVENTLSHQLFANCRFCNFCLGCLKNDRKATGFIASDSSATVGLLSFRQLESLRAPVHGDQGFRLEGTTVSGG
jgi:hypothetical protein